MATAIAIATPVPVAVATSLPEDFEFFDEQNIVKLEDFVGCVGRRETNLSGGAHTELHTRNGKEVKEKPDFKLSNCYTKFGLAYGSKEDAEKYDKKLCRHLFVKKEVDVKTDAKTTTSSTSSTTKSDEKKAPMEPGYVVALPLRQNQHLVPWCNSWDKIGKRVFSEHSKTLSSNGKFIPFESMDLVWGSISKIPMNKLNAEKYGPSLKIKVDGTTLCYKKTPCGKYDVATTMEDLWGKEGTYTFFGNVHKLNIDVKGGHSISFLATVVQFAPKVIGAGKAAKHLNLAPKDYVVPCDTVVATATATTAVTTAGTTAGSVATATSTTESSGSTADPEDEPLGITGKRKFVNLE
jgi:hypothetical protein